jgi:hypothetical protein
MRRETLNIATQRYSDESNGEEEERDEEDGKYAERQQSRKQHEDQIPRSRSARGEHSKKPLPIMT